MRRAGFLGAVLAATLIFLPQGAWAHAVRTDNSTTVELHVAPEDNPTPGQSATLFFSFDDTTNRFSPVVCHCALTISEQGREISRQVLDFAKAGQPGDDGYGFAFTFPKRDSYHLMLTGEPKQPGVFEPFTVAWDFRVNKASPVADSQPSLLQTFLTYMGVLLGVSVTGGIIVFVVSGGLGKLRSKGPSSHKKIDPK